MKRLGSFKPLANVDAMLRAFFLCRSLSREAIKVNGLVTTDILNQLTTKPNPHRNTSLIGLSTSPSSPSPSKYPSIILGFSGHI
jgi:hypothetical protein